MKLRYEGANLENFKIAYNIQKKIWTKEAGYNSFLDKATNY